MATKPDANAMIMRDNPEMTEDKIAYSIEKLKEYGIVDSGDARELGIGAMKEERMETFLRANGRGRPVRSRSSIFRQAYTLEFTNNGVGRGGGTGGPEACVHLFGCRTAPASSPRLLPVGIRIIS